MIDELIKQHRKSNMITDKIIQLCGTKTGSNIDLNELKDYLKTFVYMYRYHESREDTEVFVWFKNSFKNKKEYDDMGEKFEKEEEEKFGEDGFVKTLKNVQYIEKKLNIYNLESITSDVEIVLRKHK